MTQIFLLELDAMLDAILPLFQTLPLLFSITFPGFQFLKNEGKII